MCARVQSDVLRVLRVLRGPVFQFCTCLWRHVFGVLRVLCVLLGLYVLYALCELYAFSKPYVQHRGPQKRASGQKRTDGSQRNIRGVWYTRMSMNNDTPHAQYFERMPNINMCQLYDCEVCDGIRHWTFNPRFTGRGRRRQN